MAVVVAGLVGVTVGGRMATISSPASPSQTAAPSIEAPFPRLVVQRSHATCGRQGSLAVLPATPFTTSSAWVTCGAASEEIVIGTDTVTDRPGLGAIATDGTTEWAIRGDSVVQLNPDRSVAQAVRIGTPSAIAVGSGAVWVLDTRTRQLSMVVGNRVVTTVTPAPTGRPIAIAIAGGSLWVLDQAEASLLRLDLNDGHQVGAVGVAATPTFMVVAAGALYVASPVTDTIVRIDPVSGAATTLRPDFGADGYIDALGGSRDGIVLGSRTGVFRLDPVTAAVTAGAFGDDYVSAVGLDGKSVLVLTQDATLLEAILP
jgi:hypothetical protein